MVACRLRDGARGLRHPAPDRRGDDEPRPHGGEDPSALRPRAGGACQRREPRGRRRLVAAVAGDARRDRSRRSRAEYRKVAEAHERSEAEKTARAARRRRAPMRCAIDWSAYRPTTPSFLGTRVFESYDLAELARYIDWTPFFQTWELKGRYPAILDDPEAGRGGAAAVRRRAGDAEADRRGEVVRAQGGRRLLAGGARGDDIALFADEARGPPIATLYTLRQQLGKRDGRPNLALADFVGRAARLCRRLRGHRRRRGRGDRRALRARQRRLFVDPGQGARRPARRGLRRGDARARAARALGLCAGRGVRAGGADRRALSRHPPGARLSGPARPHREGDAVPPARRRARDRA